MSIKWSDAQEIGFLLFEQNPELDPLTLRFTQLHELVRELPDFDDDPGKSSEKVLEAIQMAWYDEYQNR